jgi:hypothetical protein
MDVNPEKVSGRSFSRGAPPSPLIPGPQEQGLRANPKKVDDTIKNEPLVAAGFFGYILREQIKRIPG